MKKEVLNCGDIVKCRAKTEKNRPYLFFIYLYSDPQKYICLTSDGKIIPFTKGMVDIEKIGHSKEFDALMLALKGLKTMEEQKGDANEPDNDADHR